MWSTKSKLRVSNDGISRNAKGWTPKELTRDMRLPRSRFIVRPFRLYAKSRETCKKARKHCGRPWHLLLPRMIDVTDVIGGWHNSYATFAPISYCNMVAFRERASIASSYPCFISNILHLTIKTEEYAIWTHSDLRSKISFVLLLISFNYWIKQSTNIIL